jgi:hypothetical protein
MKRSSYPAIFIGLTTLMSSSFIQAEPLYYIFEGRAWGGNPELYHELTGVSADDVVTYVFRVDDEVPNDIYPDGTSVEYGHQ